MWDAVIEDFLRQFAQSQKRSISLQVDGLSESIKPDEESTEPYSHIRQLPKLATGPTQGMDDCCREYKALLWCTIHISHLRFTLPSSDPSFRSCIHL